MIRIRIFFVLCALLLSCAGQKTMLSDEEAAQGWFLLFNTKTFEGWRGFKKPDVPKGWSVSEKGELFLHGAGGGDIMTTEQFLDFELSLEWKISPKGNSGIMFRVSEDKGAPWHSGPEMQILDNEGHRDGTNPKTSAGSNFALHAPFKDVTQKIGKYNKARILVKGNHVEHWLNDKKLLEYEIESPEWEQLVAKSKFSKHPIYGRQKRGHIVLQDHGDQVWFRNIKMRRL